MDRALFDFTEDAKAARPDKRRGGRTFHEPANTDSLGHTIWQILTESGIGLREGAAILGVNPSRLSSVVSGKLNLSQETATIWGSAFEKDERLSAAWRKHKDVYEWHVSGLLREKMGNQSQPPKDPNSFGSVLWQITGHHLTGAAAAVGWRLSDFGGVVHGRKNISQEMAARWERILDTHEDFKERMKQNRGEYRRYAALLHSGTKSSAVFVALIQNIAANTIEAGADVVTPLSRVVATQPLSPWGNGRINLKPTTKKSAPRPKRIKNTIGPVIGRIIGDAYGCLHDGSELLGIEPNPLSCLIHQTVGVSPEIYDKMKHEWPAKFAEAYPDKWAKNEDDYYRELANIVVVRPGPKTANTGNKNKVGPIVGRVIAKENRRVAMLRLGFDEKQPGTFSLFLHGKIPVPRKLLPMIEKIWPEALAEYPQWEANKRAYHREAAAIAKGCPAGPAAADDVKENWHEAAGEFFSKVLKQQGCLNGMENNVSDAFMASISARRPLLRDAEIWGQMLSGDKAVLPKTVNEALVAIKKAFPEIARDITAKRLEKQYNESLSKQGGAAPVKYSADGEAAPFYRMPGLRALRS